MNDERPNMLGSHQFDLPQQFGRLQIAIPEPEWARGMLRTRLIEAGTQFMD
jgi:hypothetical protein